MIRFTIVFLFCTLLVNCVTKDEKETEQRPNIILLMGDDHGWEETGYNGHEYLKTPVLDEMASTGLRLDYFYAAAPVCSPTRGSVITGRHPNRYGTFNPNRSIRPEEISIAQVLKKAGYATGHFGKWHLGPVKANSPTNPGAMGFDTWLSHDNFFEMDPTFSRDGEAPVQIFGESSEILVEETLKFIEKSKREGKPFFAVVWFGSPHEPYQGLEKDLALYENLPDSLSQQFVGLTSLKLGRKVERPLDSVLQARYAEITAMDRAIGQLRNQLSDDGLKENTLLWYCGDNGTPASGLFDTPLRGRKGMVYDGGIRVPGIIEWPKKINKARTSRLNTVTSDMFPTLCDLIGVSTPSRPMDGISLNPLLNGDVKNRTEPIFFWNFKPVYESGIDPKPYIDTELQVGTTPLAKMMNGKYTRTFKNDHHILNKDFDYEGSKAVLDNQYKLVVNGGNNGDSKELFNIKEDPSEHHDLIDTHADIANELEKKLLNWQKSVLHSLMRGDYE